MSGLFGASSASNRAGEWARKAHGMLAEFPAESAEKAAALIIGCYEQGGKVLACGNGGSAMEAQHLVAELVGRFERDRASLPALALHQNSATLTAVANDYDTTTPSAHKSARLG